MIMKKLMLLAAVAALMAGCSTTATTVDGNKDKNTKFVCINNQVWEDAAAGTKPVKGEDGKQLACHRYSTDF